MINNYFFSQNRTAVSGQDTYTKILSHFDNSGVDSSTYNRTPTTQGSPTYATSSKFGTHCLKLPASQPNNINYPDSSDFTIGTGEFTIDLWFKCDATSKIMSLCGQNESGFGGKYWHFMIYSENKVYFQQEFGTGGSAPYYLDFKTTSAMTISTGTWYHIALVRTGTTFKIFWNGVSKAISFSGGSGSTSVGDEASKFHIGSNGLYGANGIYYIDEFRFSNGIARWTADFTPPTSAY